MNVLIRPLVENDAYVSVKWRNMPEIWLYTAYKWTHEILIEDELSWIRKVIADPSGKRFAIMADDKYIGNIYLTNIKNRTGEYSIFIGEKDYWGKGIARKASEQIITFAREAMHLQSIILGVNENNVAAITLYRSLGFRPTGKDNQFTWMKLIL